MPDKDPTVLMAHMIPFFPDEAASCDVAEALLDAGVKYLEIQFPFTDPTADGPTIEEACTVSLARGFTVDKGFAFVKSFSALADKHGASIFIMTYASLAYTRGIERFVREAAEAGARGLIIPDLPIEQDEGLAEACKKVGIESIPVIIPHISPDRLKLVLDAKPAWVYCALRAGITGTETELDAGLVSFLDNLRSEGVKVFGGFGIQRPEQISVLKKSVYGVVVGSAIVRKITQTCENKDMTLYDSVGDFAKSLVSA